MKNNSNFDLYSTINNSVAEQTNPKVVIGLPVYNGENYLRPAIESILAQTLTNFLLIISDNASTDATEEICREFAACDSRIIYHRQKDNIGAAPNFNFVFQPRLAPYFKWAAHDDILDPDYLRQCVELLDRDSKLAVAHCLSYKINDQGEIYGTHDNDLPLNSSRPSERFWRVLWANHFTDIFGVMRTDLLTQTKLHGSYVGSDRNLMAEILLLGDMGYVKQRLFLHRVHKASYMGKLKDNASRLAWFDPKVKISTRLVGYVKFKEYLDAITHLPLPLNERIACMTNLAEWGVRRGIEIVTGDRDLYRKKLLRQYGFQQISPTLPAHATLNFTEASNNHNAA
ncbi:glycosyltransferase family 2 protein [Lyngbya sp. PCC 8106]|uniref:glycosyltransferase family 2 protein n=1 Tax=Lyngbya sp. (strain PCC 8106) TaxID=313612 RepID=UPI0000EAA52E|nr:glycosyltransferase family 2 protein [Lyngbya sp. PCC 8106]EAW35319.1 putative glycosyl transferase [Lyngbya sp. PCC 8106]